MAAADPKSAAICGELAATTYGLPIVERDIQDNSANATRFLVLGRQGPPASGNDRTSIMFSIRDEVGALHKALAPFRKYQLNMTKIESRPSKRKAWEYFFFVDCDGHCDTPKVAKAIEILGAHCSFVKVLGSYPNGD
jgi:chorismate mutase/prephenate dehydratase